MTRLLDGLEGQDGLLAVAGAVEGRDQLAGLVRHADLAVGQPLVAERLAGLGVEEAPALRLEEIDARRDGEGQAGMAVGRRREGQVGQREDGAALANAAAVQVLGPDLHASPGVTVAHFQKLDTGHDGEFIALKKFLNGHNGLFLIVCWSPPPADRCLRLATRVG